MLKRASIKGSRVKAWPAAFRRLCVETRIGILILSADGTAAFRRLCVETHLNC